MKAAVFEGVGRLTVKEVPDPVLADGEILLEIEACGMCGVDLRTFRNGDAKIAPPRILGHEFCGRIAESRANGAGVPAVGDRVVMYIVLPCATCPNCQGGRTNLCENRTTMSYQHDGGLAQYMRVPAAAVRNGHLFKVASGIAPQHMALAEPLGCVTNAHGRLGIGKQDAVAVIGAGPIGVMHGLLSRLAGARKVFLLDTSTARLKMAETFDFDAYVVVQQGGHLERVRELTAGRGPSVVIVACASASAQADALEMAAKGGRVEFFGGLPQTSPTAVLNTNHIHYKELVVSGSYSEKIGDFKTAQALLHDRRFPADKLVTHELPLDRVTDAFGLMESGEALKVCIRP